MVTLLYIINYRSFCNLS